MPFQEPRVDDKSDEGEIPPDETDQSKLHIDL